MSSTNATINTANATTNATTNATNAASAAREAWIDAKENWGVEQAEKKLAKQAKKEQSPK